MANAVRGRKNAIDIFVTLLANGQLQTYKLSIPFSFLGRIVVHFPLFSSYDPMVR